MKKPTSSSVLVALLLLLLATACEKENNPAPKLNKQKDIAVIDSAITAFMALYNIPGASLAVTKSGKLVYRKGYGVADVTTGEKVTPDHRFRLASLTKTYTAASILKLVQGGKLSLDDKVFGAGAVLGTEYGTPPYNENLRNITVRHLLQNVSGSWGPLTGGDVIDLQPSFTNSQFLNWVVDTRPNPVAPATLYDYSNVGFWIAGRVLEKVSGKSYINYIKEDLLAPIGATQTEIAGKTAGERKPKEVRYHGQGTDADWVYNILFSRRDADGGLIATASDVARFLCAIDGLPARPDILTSASVNELTTGSSALPAYGLGIVIWHAENLWFNYGSLPGTRTGFMRHDNGMTAVLLLNSRVDPSAGEAPFVLGMQAILLDLVKNDAYPWQAIDQF